MSNAALDSNSFEEAKKMYIELEVENFVELLKELKYSEELTEKNNKTSAKDKRNCSLNIRSLAKTIATEYTDKLINDYKISSGEKLWEIIDKIPVTEINKRKFAAKKQILGD